MAGGRPKGSRNRKSAALRRAENRGQCPLDYLMSVLQDEDKDDRLRFDAAKAILPYMLPRLSAVTVSNTEYNGDPATITDQQLYEFILAGSDEVTRKKLLQRDDRPTRKPRPWEKAVNGKTH